MVCQRAKPFRCFSLCRWNAESLLFLCFRLCSPDQSAKNAIRASFRADLFGDFKEKYGLRCLLHGMGARWPSITIEALSKQYLINTSTLKEVFKTVYGLSIATYMKEYLMVQTMKLLRETSIPISEIADRVGYETKGKFSKAFKDVTQMLPSEYRRTQDSNWNG